MLFEDTAEKLKGICSLKQLLFGGCCYVNCLENLRKSQLLRCSS